MKHTTQTPAAEHHLKQFHDKTFVVKASGEVFANPEALNSVIEDIAFLTKSGVHCVLVFGGGSQLNAALDKSEVHPKTKLRITPKEALASIQAEREKIWGKIHAACEKIKLPSELLPLKTVQAQKIADHGETAQVAFIHAKNITDILDGGKTAVVGFGGEEKGSFLNVNADNIAAVTAQAVDAAKLIMLGNTNGIYVPNGNGEKSKLDFLDLEELLCLLQETDAQGAPVINGGMVPKVHACVKAAAGGVPQVHILHKADFLPGALSVNGAGTHIEKIHKHHVAPANPGDLPALIELHQGCLSAKTPSGTPYLKPQSPEELAKLIPTTFVLKHKGKVIGKMHYTETGPKSFPLLGGFAVGENYQNGKYGCALLQDVLKALHNAGYLQAISITASPAVKKRYAWNGGTTQITETWKQELLAASQKRYGAGAHLAELFTFDLNNLKNV